MPNLIQPEKINLKNHPVIKEAWIQEQIANDPSILGLGDLILRDKERPQARAGRLDLLLQDQENSRRYEVEVQLGKCDESHIIRTIEYWDIERKRYPQYDHCAVIIAEDITSRFLNVISLFNGQIPLIAIQLSAYQYQDGIALIFTKVLDEMPLGLVDEDEDIRETTDRNYWISKANDSTVKMVDSLLHLIKELDPEIELKYNKYYIGLSKQGQPFNIISFRPRKNDLNISIRIPQSDEIQDLIEAEGFTDMGYEKRWRQYRLKLSKGEIKKKENSLRSLFESAYQNAT